MTTLLLDLRHTLRAIRRAPLLFATAVFSIALGVGANTAVFSWMDNLVLRPFPGVHEPSRVVGPETAFPTGDGGPVSYPTFRDWQAGSRSFAGMALWSLMRASGRHQGATGSTSLIVMPVSGEYFDVLGGSAAVGRVLRTTDEHGRAPVVVLGYEAWLREFKGDRAAIGRVLFLNGEALTVVGVAAPRFVGTYLGVVPDLFVPVTLQPTLTGVNLLDDRAARSFQLVARLNPGVTIAAAEQELDGLARAISHRAGDRPVLGAKVTEARLRFLGGLVSPMLSATLVVTALLLLVACANIAGLLLVRATARSSELSLRLALGASAAQIGRLILLESLILGSAGSGLGVGVAYLARGVLYGFLPTATYPLTLAVAINPRVLLFAIATAFLVTVLCALVPALRSRRLPAGAALRSSAPALAPAASRIRFALVAGQLAFALTCLVTAGRFLTALRSASDIDLGFGDPGRVLLVNTDFAATRLPGSEAALAIQEILRITRAIPGVSHASVASLVPLGFGGRRVTAVKVDGYTPGADEDMSVLRIVAGPDYAASLGIPIVEGRDFRDTDRGGAEPVAIVNAAFARRFLPNRSALGRRVDAGGGLATIVGVLADGKYGTLAELPQPVAYLPIAQAPQPTFTLQLRTEGNPLALVEPVRAALRAVHADLPVLQPRTLADHISASTFVPRVGATILSVFGGVALLLAVVGLHAAVAFSVAIRTRDLGIRMALGAGARQILRVVLGPAVGILGVGAAAGAALSLGLGRLLESRIPALAQVSLLDPTVAAGSVVVLGLAALLAAWLPAARALRVDPSLVLREG